MKTLYILLLVSLPSLLYGQEGQFNLDSLNGIWENENGHIHNYLLISGHKKITISGSLDSEYFIREKPYGLLGLKNIEAKLPSKISELGKEGNNIITYDDSVKYFDNNGNLKRPLYNSLILFNENIEDENSLKAFSIVGINGKSDIYFKINNIPDFVVKKIKSNKIDWKKFKDFLNILEATIINDKVYIYNNSYEKTSMSLYKGDKVEILNKKGD